MVKNMQTSIICYVMFVLDVFCGDYVGVSDQGSVCVVSVGYVRSNGVWRTSVWWGSVEETVVRIWSGIPSCLVQRRLSRLPKGLLPNRPRKRRQLKTPSKADVQLL